MKRLLPLLLIVIFGMSSCNDDNKPTPPEVVERTVFMYLPWSSNLLPFFQTNIDDFESAIAKGILGNERFLVFLSTTATDARLDEIKYKNGKTVRETLKTYSFDSPVYTTAAGITSILNDVVKYAPAGKYGMTIGCHGMGWIPVGASSRAFGVESAEKEFWEQDVPLTRWYGGSSPQYQTDITSLRDGIKGAGLKMEYILFDDCYMSSIEVAYDLREVAGHIIGCPTEVMVYGMPYETIAPYLVGTVNYEKATDAFLEFYENYPNYPYGTIGVTVCSELDNLAAIMKEINTAYPLGGSTVNWTTIQRMDGYSPIRFFDYRDYVKNLSGGSGDLFERYETQMEKAFPARYQKHTAEFPYAYGSSVRTHVINTYSGVTTSDPSTSSVTDAKTQTSWYAATH